MTKLRIGTRGSNLALWQANYIRDRLVAGNPELDVELVIISTKGDRVLDRPLSQVGGKGLFVKEIEHALANGEIDLAVHSLKDMPADQPDGLELSCFTERASPFDVLCGKTPGVSADTLPKNPRIGTTSLRRGAQIKRLRPDSEVISIRGNVETRLSKRGGEMNLDAVILAEAGLRRLKIWEDGFSVLRPPEFIPAPAQGALAIETRVEDASTKELLAPLDDLVTRVCISAERACLAGIEGNCHTPFGAYATWEGEEITLHARLLDEAGRMIEGRRMVVLHGADPLDAARELGATLAKRLLERWNADEERA